MAKQSILLDPDAQAYTDDEIVGKVNAAAANITRENAVTSPAVDLSEKDADDLAESATKKYAGVSGADFKKSVDTLEEITEGSTKKHFTSTEKTKLTGVEEGAEANIGEEFLTTEKTKLTGIEPGAEVNVGEEYSIEEATKLAGVEDGAKADQTGAEIRDAVVALPDVDRKLVITEPIVGEFPVLSIQRKATGKIEVSIDDVPKE